MGEVHNAKITGTTLGPEDHGILTSYVTCDFGRTQGFGGYDLRHSDSMAKWISGVLRVTGADDWSKVTGKYVRVRRGNYAIEAIGHIVEDRWFEADSMYEKEI